MKSISGLRPVRWSALIRSAAKMKLPLSTATMMRSSSLSRGDLAGELIDAGCDRLGAEQRLDRAASSDVHGRHLALAKLTWRLRTLSGGEGICTMKGDLARRRRAHHVGRRLARSPCRFSCEGDHDLRHVDLAAVRLTTSPSTWSTGWPRVVPAERTSSMLSPSGSPSMPTWVEPRRAGQQRHHGPSAQWTKAARRSERGARARPSPWPPQAGACARGPRRWGCSWPSGIGIDQRSGIVARRVLHLVASEENSPPMPAQTPSRRRATSRCMSSSVLNRGPPPRRHGGLERWCRSDIGRRSAARLRR